MSDEEIKKVQCSTHGSTPWNGQVVCAKNWGGCGRLWHLGDETHERHPPAELNSLCVCGKLLGSHKDSPSRAVCPQCFEGALAVQQEGLA